MSRIDELDRQYREVELQQIKEFEGKLRQEEEEEERRLADQEVRRSHEMERIVRLLEVSPESMENSTFDGEPEFNQRLTELWPSLVDRPSHRASDAKRLALHPGLAIPGARTVPVYASSVRAANRREVTDIAAELGYGWYVLTNPAPIRIKDELRDYQYGLCGWAQAYRAPQWNVIYFTFVADATSMWDLAVLADFHGFYVLNATRGFLLCRDSRVTLDVSLDVYQYFWFGERRTQLLNEESDTGFRYGFYDQSPLFEYRCPLRADPMYPVFVRMLITAKAEAYHGYAQINFADGANYIDPVTLIAWSS